MHELEIKFKELTEETENIKNQLKENKKSTMVHAAEAKIHHDIVEKLRENINKMREQQNHDRKIIDQLREDPASMGIDGIPDSYAGPISDISMVPNEENAEMAIKEAPNDYNDDEARKTVYNSVKTTAKEAEAENGRAQSQENLKRRVDIMRAAVHGNLKTRIRVRLEDEMRRKMSELFNHHHEHKKLVAFEHEEIKKEMQSIRETIMKLGKTLTDELIKAENKINKRQDKLVNNLQSEIKMSEQRGIDRVHDLEHNMVGDMRARI